MTDPATLRQRLVEAEAALHRLSIGAHVASLRDAGGRQVNYTPGDEGRLRAYITSLQSQLGVGGRARAARVFFG